MSKVTVYQFTKYDISVDGNRKSRRWATREAIERVGGDVLEDTATEVEAFAVASDIEGMTVINFDPHRRTTEFNPFKTTNAQGSFSS
jgi:hypothetical protein